jgi:glycosyltransferase involved in cell wall biosynthesis
LQPPLDVAETSVLHVLAPAEVGGLETVVPALVLGSRGSAVRAHVAAIVPRGRTDHPFLASFRDTGVEPFTIEVPPRGYLRERREFGKLLRALRPDIVHTHGYRADVLDAPVAREAGIPVVSTVHGFGVLNRRNRVYHWLQRRALRRFDAVIAVSRGLVDDLTASGIPRDRMRYVQNGWFSATPPLDRDAACRTLGIFPNGFRAGWVGRLSTEKGPDILVDALPHLRDVALKVSIVGEGPLRQTLHDRAAALDVSDRISWHGLIPGAGRLLPAFGVLVLTSRAEGTPMVLFEAMAAGIPIIAARVGGVPDMLSNREALLVPAENPLAFAEALREISLNPDAAKQRAAMARERLERQFGYRTWLGQYESIYRALSGRH